MLTTTIKEKADFEKLNKLIEARNMNINQVANALQIPRRTMYDWKNGVSVPKAFYLIKIARFFGVTVEYFYEE